MADTSRLFALACRILLLSLDFCVVIFHVFLRRLQLRLDEAKRELELVQQEKETGKTGYLSSTDITHTLQMFIHDVALMQLY